MADENSQESTLPSLVGDASRRYIVIKRKKLGSGGFADVFLGLDQNTCEKVAIKFDRSVSSRTSSEWAVLRSMNGNGAPHVYYTGFHSPYIVIVMELLGPSLEAVMELRNANGRHSKLPWDTVAWIAQRSLQLLHRLHSKGYVHGDIKPENFLCYYGEGGAIDQSRGLKIIDFGLSSLWRDLSEPNGHVPYDQGIDHFSGTVIYASLNAHLGRVVSRRDDLESLVYMLLYLCKGSLKWQGLSDQDINMQICELKGCLPIEDICEGAPEVLQHVLAYVRQMKFAEEPDYEYLLSLCSEGGKGIKEVTNFLGPKENMASFVKLGNQGTLAVDTNRKQPDSNRETERFLKDSDLDTPKYRTTHQRTLVTICRAWDVPRGESRYLQAKWVQSLHIDMRTLLKHGIFISDLSFAGGVWTCELTKVDGPYTEQVLHYCSTLDFSGQCVNTKWQGSYLITSIAGDQIGWGLVLSKMERDEVNREQLVMVSRRFPSQWVAEKWKSGYYITSVATQGRLEMQWCVVMTSTTRFEAQCVELDFKYPEEGIAARSQQGYSISSAMHTKKMYAFVLSKLHESHA